MKASAALIGLLLATLPCFAAASAAAPATQAVSFARDVAPILLERCQGCHGAAKVKGRYRLDTFERLNIAGDGKAAPLAPGDPNGSELFKRVTTADEDERMPQKADPLPAAEVLVLRRWIEAGARFDGRDAKASLASLVPDRAQPAPPEAYRTPVPITALAFSLDGATLAAGGYHEVTFWNPTDGQLRGRVRRTAERVYGLAYSPDGTALAVAAGTPGVLGEVRICDPARNDPGRVLERTGDVMLAVRYAPDGKRLAACGADGAVRIFDAATGKRAALIEQHADWVLDVAFSPDGGSLVTASRDKSARVFDAASGTMRSAFLAHEEPVFAVAWNGSGSVVYSAGHDRRIRAWAAADGKPTGAAASVDADPLRMVAALDLLFVAGADGAVRQYSADKLELVRTYPPASPAPAYAIAIDAPRRRLAIGGHDGLVRVFAIDGGPAICSFVAAPGYQAK